MNLMLERPISVVEGGACMSSLPLLLVLLECVDGHVSHGLSHVRVVHHPWRANCRPPLPHLASAGLIGFRLLFLFFFFFLFLDNYLRPQPRLLLSLFTASVYLIQSL